MPPKALAGRAKKAAGKAIPIPSTGVSFLPPRRRGGKDAATSPTPIAPDSKSFRSPRGDGDQALHPDLVDRSFLLSRAPWSCRRLRSVCASHCFSMISGIHKMHRYMFSFTYFVSGSLSWSLSRKIAAEIGVDKIIWFFCRFYPRV